jgi:hypothetical protein
MNLKKELAREKKERIAYSPECYIRELDAKHLDPWNIQQWKDWEYCQGGYKEIYSIDTNINRRELRLINAFIKQFNAENKKDPDRFLLVTKLSIILEKKRKYDTLSFYVYDKVSTITREYTVQYKWLNEKEVEIINGFRTRTVFEDSVLETGYNIDKYNQMGRNMASYYLDMDLPKYYSVPLNPTMYSYTNTPNNLYMNKDQKISERAGTYHAENFSSQY